MVTTTSDVVRLAAVSDIHYTKTSQGQLQTLFGDIAESADILLLPGDLTDYGLAEEARILAKDLAQVKIPVIGVLGNHDFESNQEKEVAQILSDVGVHMLDGDAWECTKASVSRAFAVFAAASVAARWGRGVRRSSKILYRKRCKKR